MIASALNRRRLLGMMGAAATTALIAACGAPTAAPPTAAPPTTAPPTTAPAAAPTTAAPTTAAPTKPAAAEATKPAPAAAATTAPAVAAKAPGATEAFTVQLMQYRGEFSEDEEKTFNTKYAPLQVKLIEFDYTRLDAMFAAKQPPDMIRVYAPAVPGFKARNLILDLSDYFKASKKIDVADLWEANDYYTFAPDGLRPVRGGRRYGMVKDFAPDNTLWIWKSTFDDAKVPLFEYDNPPSYADLLAAGKQLVKKEGDRTVRFGIQPSDFWIDRVTMSMLQEIGKSLYTDDFSKVLIKDDKDVHEAFKWYYDAAFSGAQPTKLNALDDTNAGLLQGRLGVNQTGYWHTAYLRYNAKPENNLDDNSRFIGAPWFFDKAKRVSPTVTACGNVVAKATKNPDAVWAFYEYFMAEEPAQNRAKAGWGMPARKSWFERLPHEKPHEKRAFTTLQQEIKLMPTLNFNPYLGEDTVNQVWAPAIEKALRAKTPVDEMLDAVTKEINTLIKEGKDAIG